MAERLNPFEAFTRNLFGIAAGIGAVALGMHFLKKARTPDNKGEKPK